MTFEKWCEANCVNSEMLHEPDIYAEMNAQYGEEMRMEAGRIAKFGATWLKNQRNELRKRVDEVLRILSKDDTELEVKHAWLYTEVGELEYAQHIDLLPQRDVIQMKNKLFDAFIDAKVRMGVGA